MSASLTPHQAAILSIALEDLVADAEAGFDLDTIRPDDLGGYWILSAQRVPAPRGPPQVLRIRKPSNDQWTPLAPARPVTKSIFAQMPSERRGPIPLRDKRGPRLNRDESIGRHAYAAGRIVDETALRSPARTEMLRLIGLIWCAGEELTPTEVRRVLADVLKVRALVPKVPLGQHKRMQLYGHLKALIENLQGRLQLELFP